MLKCCGKTLAQLMVLQNSFRVRLPYCRVSSTKLSIMLLTTILNETQKKGKKPRVKHQVGLGTRLFNGHMLVGDKYCWAYASIGTV